MLGCCKLIRRDGFEMTVTEKVGGVIIILDNHHVRRCPPLSSIFIPITTKLGHGKIWDVLVFQFQISNQSDATTAADRESGGWMILQIHPEVGGASFFGSWCQNQVRRANKDLGQASDKV